MSHFNNSIDHHQSLSKKKKSHPLTQRLIKILTAVLLIFLLLFMMNYVVKKEVSQFLIKERDPHRESMIN